MALQPRTDRKPAAQALDVADIADALGNLACRFDVDVVDQCDSTNTLLLARAASGAASGCVVAARHQTAGRGRLGRRWLSEAGDSLAFSLLWRLPQGRPLAGLSLAVGVAIAKSLEPLGAPDIKLKWPNDVLLKGRKLAGVLIEVVPGTVPEAVVIGIGVNLQLPAAMPRDISESAAALADAGIDCANPNVLLASLLAELLAVLQCFAEHGFVGVQDDWMMRHAFEGLAVRLLSDFAPALDGRCCGVANDGALLLETASGMQRIISGEVSLRKA